MLQKFGICTCHNKHNPINSRGLCPEGAKERHEHSASMKNMVVKKKSNKKEIEKEDGFDSSRGVSSTATRKEKRSFGQDDNRNKAQKTKIDFKKRIQPRSEKKKQEDEELARIKKQKIAEIGKKCEMCDKHGEVDLFHIIGRVDKKYSIDPLNLMLSCRFCHLIWTANDWSKIVKFKNFDKIMECLKSLDEGKYWKLRHKIEKHIIGQYFENGDKTEIEKFGIKLIKPL